MTSDTQAGVFAGTLTKAERDFLSRVCDGRPLGCATREEDRARQSLRKFGLVHVVKCPRRWEALPLGLAVRKHLKDHPQN